MSVVVHHLVFSPNPVWCSQVQSDRGCIQKGPQPSFYATQHLARNPREKITEGTSVNELHWTVAKLSHRGCREWRSLFCYRSVQAAFSVFFFSFDRKFILEWNRNFIVTTVNRNCLLKYKIWGKKNLFSLFFQTFVGYKLLRAVCSANVKLFSF